MIRRQVLWKQHRVFLSSPKETATTINQEIAKYHEKSDKAALGLYELLKGATTNLSLQAQELSVKQAMKNHTIAKAMFLPTLNASYNFKNEARDTPEYKHYNTQQLQAQVTLNVFNGFSDVNNVKEKSATYRSNVANLEYSRQSVYLQVVQQYYEYFNNLARMIALQKKLEQIKTDIKRVTKLYDKGLTTIDDLQSLKAQREFERIRYFGHAICFGAKPLDFRIPYQSQCEKFEKDHD